MDARAIVNIIKELEIPSEHRTSAVTDLIDSATPHPKKVAHSSFLCGHEDGVT
jgi:hypothetical protein